jgi:gliding motility-associated-like protein
MQMKNVFSIFILFICSFSLGAQEIRYSLFIRDSQCNGANNGAAEVNVVAANPPYSYLWSFGSINKNVNGLPPDDYTVTVTDSLGNDTLIHVRINEIPCEISATLVFTPNGDGINDTWSIANLGKYPENLVLVFNRWGQKVYEHSGEYEPWDGRDYFGRELEANSYYYIIYGDKDQDKSIIKGSVSIIR